MSDGIMPEGAVTVQRVGAYLADSSGARYFSWSGAVDLFATEPQADNPSYHLQGKNGELYLVPLKGPLSPGELWDAGMCT